MKKHKNILIGLAVFVIAIVFLLFAAFPIQMKFGLIGLGLTQIGLLAIAIIGGLLLKNGWKETFPIKRLNFKELRGSFYIYVSVYFFTIAAANIMLYIFPGMGEVNSALNDFFSEGGFLLVITACLMPGICEEALFRGTIRSSFRNVKSTVAIVCISGVLFGLFHLDPYRFVPTMILGMGFTYIMVKTGNLLYTVFFHALHNFISTLPVLLGVSTETTQTGFNAVMLTGLVILFFAVGLQFLRLGIRRLNNISAGSGNKKKIIIFSVACIALAAAGLILIGMGS